MTDLPPVAQRWLDQLITSTRSIDSLVEEGFQGCSLQDLLPWMDGGQGLAAIEAIDWVKSQPDADGDVALMTADAEGLDRLLEWMLETHGNCPMVYAPEEDVVVPDGIPLLRPTAYNLPEGMSSAEVFDEEFSENLSELFAAIKDSYGNHAHLYRIDYGQLIEKIEQGIFLAGQFIDLNDGELFDFSMDSMNQRIRYQSTGRYHEGFPA
ncbi:hypothetical protein [Synechococcus sp. FACHB-909]|uniref:hypothetical protein n=1 Tax=Synechococcus sp. FACHB-909 TaxID=2692863 RepID=UPI001683A90D|nr:hypothetical protein [Synechococcus sp. FACHB-909]MBD2719505.1 hypothetical protein [Synechococcus sp. FACHB-909]